MGLEVPYVCQILCWILWGLTQREQVSPLKKAYSLGEKQTTTSSISFLCDVHMTKGTGWVSLCSTPYSSRGFSVFEKVLPPVHPFPTSFRCTSRREPEHRSNTVTFQKHVPICRKPRERIVSPKLERLQGWLVEMWSYSWNLEFPVKRLKQEEEHKQADNIGEWAGISGSI